VGGKSGLSEGCTSGESNDRAELGLPGIQQALVDAVLDTGKPTVVVLINGAPLSLPEIAERAPAVLEAWLPGEGAEAVADVLFGDVNPGGRLPLTVPRHAGQVPRFYNHKPSGDRSQWRTNYVDLPATPLYPFGHGLSYTTFEYSGLVVDPDEAPGTLESFRVCLTVANTGARAGDEVVQIYIRDPVASVTRPVKQLVAFRRISLAAGEEARLDFEVSLRRLAFYDLQMRHVVEAGEIEVMAGASSDDIRLRGALQLTGEPQVLGQVQKSAVP
jgi:beta-glucosidase